MHAQANLIDEFVGHYIRIHRVARKISQEELGRAIGVSLQQLQKYEKGTDRVGAGHLAQIAKVLEVPIEALFGTAASKTPASSDSVVDLLGTPYALQMLKALSRIEDLSVRHKLAVLIEDIANEPKG